MSVFNQLHSQLDEILLESVNKFIRQVETNLNKLIDSKYIICHPSEYNFYQLNVNQLIKFIKKNELTTMKVTEIYIGYADGLDLLCIKFEVENLDSSIDKYIEELMYI